MQWCWCVKKREKKWGVGVESQARGGVAQSVSGYSGWHCSSRPVQHTVAVSVETAAGSQAGSPQDWTVGRTVNVDWTTAGTEDHCWI